MVNPHILSCVGPAHSSTEMFSDLMLPIRQMLAIRVVPSKFIEILQEVAERLFVALDYLSGRSQICLATIVPLQDGVRIGYSLSFIKCVDDIVLELDSKMSGGFGENVYMVFLPSRHGFVSEYIIENVYLKK